jgi:phosphopentomutase
MDISKTITDVLKDFNKEYHQTNPIGKILDALEAKGIKAESEFPVPHVDRGVTEKINLIVDNHPNKVLVNLYRMDSGTYEVNAYEAVLLSKKPRSKMKP